jgi:hypothetical protein
VVLFAITADCINRNADTKASLEYIQCCLCDANMGLDTTHDKRFNIRRNLIQEGWCPAAAKAEFLNRVLILEFCGNRLHRLAKSFGVLFSAKDLYFEKVGRFHESTAFGYNLLSRRDGWYDFVLYVDHAERRL